MTALGLGAATGILGVSVGLTSLGAYFEERLGLTLLFEVRGPVKAPEDAVVVGINRDTGGVVDLPEMPRDWPRRVHGRLIENLVDARASAIVFDLDFHRERSPSEDLLLARAVSAAKRVVLFERFEAVRVRIENGSGQNSMTLAERRQPPVEVLANAAQGVAPWPLPKEGTSVYQYWTFKPNSDGLATLPAVALQIHAMDMYDDLRGYLQQGGADGVGALPESRAAIEDAADVRDLMRSLRRMLKTDTGLADRVLRAAKADGGTRHRLVGALLDLYTGPDSRYLNFYGPPGTVRTIQFHNAVRKGPSQYLDLAGKAVFVGFSDLYNPEQPDRFNTVFTGENGVDLSGVEIAATAFANLLTGGGLKTMTPLNTVLILMALGIVFALAAYSLPAIVAVPLTLLIGGAYWTVAQLSFNEFDVWLPLATPLVVELPVALFVGLIGQYLIERRQKLEVTKAIRYYLPESVVKGLTETGVDPNTLNQVRQGTCLATDMSGFTSMAEGMAPKDLAVYMNAYFDSVAQALKRHHVDVTEFHADTIMCAWLSPDSGAGDYRRHAALASLAVVETIETFNRKMGSQLYTRVGLADGPMYVGHTGGGGHFAYSILGDCANTAARLEGLNKNLGTHLLATRAVVDGLNDILIRWVGSFRLVGKAAPMEVAEIVGARGDGDDALESLCERFAAALDLFRRREWSRAAMLFKAIAEEHPADGPTRFYLGLCRRYMSDMALPDEPEIIRMDHK